MNGFPPTTQQHPKTGFFPTRHVFRYFLALLLVFSSAVAPAQIKINEFLAANQANNADPQGEFDDWIELYNAGASPVNLGGMFITDDLADPTKYMIPTGFAAQTTIQAGGRLVLWADRDTADGPLHLGFELDGDGEEIGLYASDGVTPVDTITFGDQRTDVSYGRMPDGSATTWRYFSPPTPGSPNTGGYEGRVADTSFSVDRGIYFAPVSVAITTLTPNAQIRYTLDSSEPTPSSTLYTGPISISQTTVLRAQAFRTGWLPTDIDTHTYIFPGDVIHQPAAPAGYPTIWRQGADNNRTTAADYEVDPDVVNDSAYAPHLNAALTQIPSLSVSMHVDQWFDPMVGIYANSNLNDVPEWERACSAELIYPDGRKGFAVNCGVRVAGQTSPINYKSPKLSLRLKFKDEYGPTRLRTKDPILPGSMLESFNTLVLDARLNNVWVHPSGSQRQMGQYTRDQYMNDMQNKAGDVSPHGFYAHVYLNGLYWGMYCVHERPDDSFMASYWEGEPEDFDVMKHDMNTLLSGTNTDIQAMFSLVRSGINNQTEYNTLVTQYLDLDPFINYMLVNFWAGNTDWAHKNYYVGRNHYDGSLFRYYSWDAEHVLKGSGDNAVDNNNTGGPTELHHRLKLYPEYKTRFMDRAHKLMNNGGLFSRDRAIEMYNVRINEFSDAIIMESARWGDHYGTLYTRDNQWTTELNRIRNSYFPGRVNTVLNQMLNEACWTQTDAPTYRINGSYQHGGTISSGATLTMTNPNGSGTVYYTLDGTDPRAVGGGVSSTARNYATNTPPPLTDTTRVLARVRVGTEWSPLNDAVYQIVTSDYTALRITEVMYNPAGPTAPSYWGNDDFEFVEVKNTGNHTLDLTGISLNDGVYFTFNDSSISDPHLLAPGQHIVVVENVQAFRNRYGADIYAVGPYFGSLANGGERIQLVDATSTTIVAFTYNDSAAWPQKADGLGHSIVPRDPNAPLQPSGSGDLPASWKDSAEMYGSPGRDDPGPPPVTAARRWWMY